jgi:hypothetical protein
MLGMKGLPEPVRSPGFSTAVPHHMFFPSHRLASNRLPAPTAYRILRTDTTRCATNTVSLRFSNGCRAMSDKTFSVTAATIFGIVALVHLLRLIMGWSIVIDAWTVPMWLSTHVAQLGRSSGRWGPKLLRNAACPAQLTS